MARTYIQSDSYLLLNTYTYTYTYTIADSIAITDVVTAFTNDTIIDFVYLDDSLL